MTTNIKYFGSECPLPGQCIWVPATLPPPPPHLRVVPLPTNPAYPSQPPRHDDVTKLKHFPRNWPFVGGIHRSPVNSPHQGQWRRALIFSLICVWINDWVNNREAGDLRRHLDHYDVSVVKDRLHLRYTCVKFQLKAKTSEKKWLTHISCANPPADTIAQANSQY